MVTTRLPSIPAGYEGRLVFADSDTAESLRSAIGEVLAMGPAEVRALGAAGARYVRETSSPQARGAALRDFLTALVDRPVGERV